MLYYRLQARKGRTQHWGVKHEQRPSQVEGITPYGGPLVVLVDEGDFSAADNLAACLADLHPDVTFIGRPTGGGTGAPREIVTLPHSGASVFACTIRVYRLGGELIEGRGVQPVVLVRWSRQDFFEDRDADLEAALHLLHRSRSEQRE